MPAISEAERNRRAEFIRETRAALQLGGTVGDRRERREKAADRWLSWWRHEMALRNCEAAKLLPDACARLEQIVDDRVAAAVAELKAALRGALK
jgi:hypothetical protein